MKLNFDKKKSLHELEAFLFSTYWILISSTNKNAGLPAPPCHAGSLSLLMMTST